MKETKTSGRQMTEADIHLTAKLLKIRDNCREIFGDKWEEKQLQWKPIISASMDKHKCNEIEAAYILAKELDDAGHSSIALIGTAMEMI
jgi:hypothetical protein